MNTFADKMNTIEERIKRFQDLHNNKWFHIMNWTLDLILIKDKTHRRNHIAFGSCFYFDN
jgi:hypothetical protein